MPWLLEIISLFKLALEVYKALRGMPDERRESIKAHVLEQAAQARCLALQGAKAGDYSALEDFLNRPSV